MDKDTEGQRGIRHLIDHIASTFQSQDLNPGPSGSGCVFYFFFSPNALIFSKSGVFLPGIPNSFLNMRFLLSLSFLNTFLFLFVFGGEGN